MTRNAELDPRPKRKPPAMPAPATGTGHVEQTSADHMREVTRRRGKTPVERAAENAETLRHRRSREKV